MLEPTGIRPTFMGRFAVIGDPAAARRVRHPAGGSGEAHPSASEQEPLSAATTLPLIDTTNPALGAGKAVIAGGMVYVSSVGPVDPTTGQLVRGGIRVQTRQCLENLTAALEAAGSSLDQVVWANWSLREPSRVRTVQRGVERVVPGRRAGRPGDVHATGSNDAPGSASRSGSSPRATTGRRLRSSWAQRVAGRPSSTRSRASSSRWFDRHDPVARLGPDRERRQRRRDERHGHQDEHDAARRSPRPSRR